MAGATCRTKQFAAALNNDVFAFFVGCTVAAVVVLVFYLLPEGQGPGYRPSGLSTFLLVAAVALAWLLFATKADKLREYGHGVAAVLLVVGVVVVIVMHAYGWKWLDPEAVASDRPFRTWYA